MLGVATVNSPAVGIGKASNSPTLSRTCCSGMAEYKILRNKDVTHSCSQRCCVKRGIPYICLAKSKSVESCSSDKHIERCESNSDITLTWRCEKLVLRRLTSRELSVKYRID